MRLVRWTLAGLVPAALLLTLAVAGTSPVTAQDTDDEKAKVAADALEKAVARGKELFGSKSLGRKTCKSCHEDPDKPQDDLSQVAWSYPAYSRRKRGVVTLQQKINEMIQYKARGKAQDGDSEDLAALAAYVTSIRKN